MPFLMIWRSKDGGSLLAQVEKVVFVEPDVQIDDWIWELAVALPVKNGGKNVVLPERTHS